MALSTDDLLEIWRRYLPTSYTDPIESGDDQSGFDVIHAMATMFERIAEANETTTQAMYVYPHSTQVAPPASGSTQSTGNLTLTRIVPTDGDLELLEGDEIDVMIRTPEGDYVFEGGLELSADVTLPEGSSGPFTVAARSIRYDYRCNFKDTLGRLLYWKTRTVLSVEDATTTVTNTITDTGIGDRLDAGMDKTAFVRFTAGPNYPSVPRRITAITVGASTTTITVDGPALVAGVGTNDFDVIDLNDAGVLIEFDGDFTGATSGMLDFLGQERDLDRTGEETDDSYRERVHRLPDTVSYNAVYRAVSRILTPLGINFRVVESRRVSQFRGFFADLDPCDDPLADILTNQRLVLGNRFDIAGFFVIVEKTGDGEFGMFADYDPPASVGPRNAVDFGFADGFPSIFWKHMRSLIDEVEKTREMGVPWLLVLVQSL